MPNQTNRGGLRIPGPGKINGRPPGSTNAAKGLETAKRVQVSLYPRDAQAAKELVKLGYGRNVSDVIREALREALERVSKEHRITTTRKEDPARPEACHLRQ